MRGCFFLQRLRNGPERIVMTQKQKSLKKNFLMNAFLTMSTFVFPLITFPYVSRILLPDGTGKVSFATSFISYFNMFAQMGIPAYGIRACASVRDDRKKLTQTAHELLFINVFLSLVSYFAFVGALIFIPRLHDDSQLLVVVSSTIILNAIGMEWLYKALEQYDYITKKSIIFKLIALVFMFLLIHKKDDYVIYGGITIFAASASNILNFLNVHKYIEMKWIGGYDIKRHMKPILVFFAMACATTIYTHMDTVMLGFLATDADVGYYNAAIKIKQILVSLVTSLGVVLFPRASYYVEHGETEQFARISKKALNFVFLVAIPMMVYFTIYARQGIIFLSGNAYEASIKPMQIVMPTLLFIGLTNILGMQMLVPLGKEKVVLWSEVVGAIINLIVNILLIPRFVSSGAAIGTVVSEFAVLVVQYIVLQRTIGTMLKSISYWKIVVAVCIGAIVSFRIPEIGFGSFLTLAISAVLFFGVYGVTLLVLKEQMTQDVVNQALGFVKRKLGRK